ncbi:MAG: hypothetical protein Q8N53_16010 [Longimicrobiales bacterium]|nr:hypothetical protein [Longimicrobiales bacterium]
MQVLRRPETAQGRPGFRETGSSALTRTVDKEIVEATRGIRGERYHLMVGDLIDLFEQGTAEKNLAPLDPRAFARVRDLLDSLPHAFPVPEVGLDPDGEIALDWIRPDHTMVSLSLGGEGDVSYAGLFRDGTARGMLRLGMGFPSSLTTLLRRLYHPV